MTSQSLPVPETPAPPEPDVEAGVLALLAALRRGERPDLAAAVPPGPARVRWLAELAHAEIEFRRKAGEEVRIDDLLARYPELAADPDIGRDLMAAAARYGSAAVIDTPDPGFPREWTPSSHPPDPPASGGRGRCIGRYEVRGRLGAGGMGEVWAAFDPVLRREVAVKVLRPHLAADPRARDRFLREARAAAAVHHDHIVPVFEVGEADGVPFLVMPLLAGESLAARLARDRALPTSDVRRLAADVASGLAAAHARGVVHRDVKPSNLWLEAAGPGGWRARVLDFGLALSPDPSARLTDPNALLGTPAYMAPEQAAGREVDARADLFALGAVLYEAATGRPAFSGDAYTAVLTAVALHDPPAARQVNPAVPRPLSDLIQRMLAKDPNRRPQTAQAVLEALTAVTDSPVRPPVTCKPRSRWWIAAALGALAIVMFAVALGRAWRTAEPDGARAIDPPAADTELRVTEFELAHYAWPRPGFRTRPPGVIGRQAFWTRQGDRVTWSVRLSRPAYTYLIVLRPDGGHDLTYPYAADEPPPLSERAQYPAPNVTGKGYGMSEAPGLWVFAAVVSADPLPPFAQWRDEHPLPTVKGTTGMPGAVLRRDGSEPTQVLWDRGPERGRDEDLPGHAVFNDITEKLTLAAPAAVVRTVGVTAVPPD